MSLIDKIENLQKKPEAYRKKVLFASLTVIMILIIAIWISTFNLSFSKKQKEEMTSSVAPLEVLKGDWDDLKETAGSPIKDIKNIFNSIKDNYEKRGSE
ncbi:hypothetical protein KJ763_00605 [Patescibacteria group bacterium]|nr:hypothetical protein [Patescibacteria group bacterium]